MGHNCALLVSYMILKPLKASQRINYNSKQQLLGQLKEKMVANIDSISVEVEFGHILRILRLILLSKQVV